MSEERWIWIARWEDFQHYRHERDQAPAWIKDYTKQMNDSRYLALSDRQRALLVDLRRIHAMSSLRTPCDHAVIARHRHRRTLYRDIEALRDAGFIEILSRADLEKRLESFYTRERRKKKEEDKDTPLPPPEVGDDDDQQPHLSPREAGTNPRAIDERERQRHKVESIRQFVQNYWDEYPDKDVLVDELTDPPRSLHLDEAVDIVETERLRREGKVMA